MQDMIDKMMVECKLFLDKNDCACLLKEWKPFPKLTILIIMRVVFDVCKED